MFILLLLLKSPVMVLLSKISHHKIKVCLFILSSFFLISCGGSGSPDSSTEPTNTKPLAVISPASDQSINVNSIINFKGNGSSDADGNTPLTYQWAFSGATTSIQSSTAENPGDVSFSEVGTVTVTLIVTDNLGLASSEAQITVEVSSTNSNQAPIGSISHDNGDGSLGTTTDISIIEGANIIFDSNITDPENDAINYDWRFNGASPATSTNEGNISVNYATAGNYTVSLVATDVNGNSSTFPAAPLKIAVLAKASTLPVFKSLPLLSPTIVNGVAKYTLNVEENVNVTIDSPSGSWTTPMMRYNSLPLQPVIAAKRGDKIEVTVNNKLTSNEATTVHWHGFKIPGVEDGGPDFPIAANTSRTYTFTMNQAAAPLWFHPHAHGTTATQVYKGLAGAFILTDDITESLESNNQLPSASNDVALLVQDRQFTDDPNNTGIRNLVYSSAGVSGMLGDVILVNGVEMPALEVSTSQYRFRIFNGSNARTYDFALDTNANFYVVSTDGGLLNNPVAANHIMLSAGERAEIVVDFSNAYQQNITLISKAFSAGGGMGGGSSLANGDPFDVMRFDVTTQITDTVTLYTSLPTNADINSRLTAAMADTSRTFVMSMSGGGGMQFLINNKVFDINRIDETVASGATEIWEISNTSQIAHPFHAHAIQWQILDRGTTGGTLTPSSGIDLGWKDTVLVQPNETVRFIGKFDPVINSGKYMYHCHILEHEDNGMMGVFEVLP